jgi:hypothetical protein
VLNANVLLDKNLSVFLWVVRTRSAPPAFVIDLGVDRPLHWTSAPTNLSNIAGRQMGSVMLRAIGYAIGTPVTALAGAYLIYAVWDTLIRHDIVPNSSLGWFPALAVLWGCLCLGAGGFLYRRNS